VETYTAAYTPDPTYRGNFEFGLKYDDLNLEWMSRFFNHVDPSWIIEWVTQQPRSAYARKTAFFYEWLTGKDLPAKANPVAEYENAIDEKKYLTSRAPVRNRRWKINDNLPGTRDYCPLIRLDEELIGSATFDMAGALDSLEIKYGNDLLMRSAAWLTFNESRASFILEKEGDRTNDIQRYASALATFCGQIENPLSKESLETLQREVLGSRALRTGIRQSPVFVGSSNPHGATVVRYIAPDFGALAPLMAGLVEFEAKTRPTEDDKKNRAPEYLMRSTLRSAALSFGFVYIHPLADGNGRIHRLLIDDTLLRDGMIPAGVILPVSSTIIRSSISRGAYQQTLERLSNRLIRRYSTDYHFGKERVCDDGVITDFDFDQYEDAMHFWRYPDLTSHSVFTSNIIRKTITEEMSNEAKILAIHDEAKIRLKRVYEMPDQDANRIIQALLSINNRGTVTNSLKKQYPALFDDEKISAEVIDAVMSAADLHEGEGGSNGQFPIERG